MHKEKNVFLAKTSLSPSLLDTVLFLNQRFDKKITDKDKALILLMSSSLNFYWLVTCTYHNAVSHMHIGQDTSVLLNVHI